MNVRKFFLKIHAENDIVILDPDLFLFLKKAYK